MQLPEPGAGSRQGHVDRIAREPGSDLSLPNFVLMLVEGSLQVDLDRIDELADTRALVFGDPAQVTQGLGQPPLPTQEIGIPPLDLLASSGPSERCFGLATQRGVRFFEIHGRLVHSRSPS